MPRSDELHVSLTVVRARSLPSTLAGVVLVVLVPVTRTPSNSCASCKEITD